MRKTLTIAVIALVAANCRDAQIPTPRALPGLVVRHSPTPPYDVVTSGPVRALIPRHWRPKLPADKGSYQQGVVASPYQHKWRGPSASHEGLAAVWVDGGRIGVPSDYYYLAATGPALDILTHSKACSPRSSRVIVDHRPAFFEGGPNSPGDYLAQGAGRCDANGQAMRWAYFVAAPGYGPVRTIGIPSSGLYVVVAVLPDARGVTGTLARLLDGAQFAGANITDFINAARR